MIYTVISRTDIINKYYETRDCSTEQPLNLISRQVNNIEDDFKISNDIIKYIRSTKNIKIKKERISAYTSLFFSLKTLFNVVPSQILRTEFSKPYINEKIFFSISHTEELTAVTLSQDIEVGVDLQEIITTKTAQRLNDRFLKEFNYDENNFKIIYLTIVINKDGKLELVPLANSDHNDQEITITDNLVTKDGSFYTRKWTAAEAFTKLSGRGLADFKKINELCDLYVCHFDTLHFNDKTYVVANAIYR